jgi:hypothetical protein
MSKEVILLTLSNPQADLIRAQAKRRGISMQEVTRRILDDWMDKVISATASVTQAVVPVVQPVFRPVSLPGHR